MAANEGKPKEDLTANELAKLAGVDSSYIRQQLIAGRLVGQKFGPIWRIPAAEAERWLSTRKRRGSRKEP